MSSCTESTLPSLLNYLIKIAEACIINEDFAESSDKENVKCRRMKRKGNERNAKKTRRKKYNIKKIKIGN